MPIEDRFNSKWIPEPNSGCWLWDGAQLPRGYGILGKGRRGKGYYYAHRLSYQLHRGEVPDGLSVLHRCDVPSCVNPDHLFLGTQKTNMEDKKAKLRHRPGEQHPNAILTYGEVYRIRAEYASGRISLSKLGGKHGLTMQHVHDIVQWKIWREMPPCQTVQL